MAADAGGNAVGIQAVEGEIAIAEAMGAGAAMGLAPVDLTADAVAEVVVTEWDIQAWFADILAEDVA
jgi:hypothetical protein